MIRASEILRINKKVDKKIDYTKTNMRLSDLGAINFGRGVTDKNVIRTPHYEIDSTLQMYELNPIVNSGVNQFVSFIFPNKEVMIASTDKRTVKFLEDWHTQRKTIIDEYRNILTTSIVCGNGYMEKYFAKTVTGDNVLDNIFSINDATRIYVNPDHQEGDGAYVFRLPIGIKEFQYMGQLQVPTYHRVVYIKNYQYTMLRVYGFAIPNYKISHLKSGWCLPPSAKIETEDGLMQIGDIVKDKLKIKVKTWNLKTKKFEFQPIVDWMKRPYKKELYKVFHTDTKSKCVTCTEEHPILTSGGYVPAKELTTKDCIAVKTHTLTPEQEALIYGTLLGDGSITKPKTRCYPRLSISHCKAQKYYLDWFEKSLSNLQPNMIKRYRHALNSGERMFEQHQLGTRQSASLLEIYNNCITKGKKKVTKLWCDKLTWLSIAVWVMDDGCVKWNPKLKYPTNVQLCTDSFSKNEVELLCETLENQFGLNSNLQERGRISIPRDSMDRLEKHVKPYIIFNRVTRKKEWVSKEIKHNNLETVKYIKIDRIEKVKYKNSYGSTTVYDLEVKNTHNFITSNVVVHNSRDNIYGRSQLASGIDANNIYMEIMSGWDTIARTKQIDQKILSVTDTETGQTLAPKAKEKLVEELNDDASSYKIITFPVKMVDTDIKVSGTYDTLDTVFDNVRRILTLSLLPQHLMPWSDTATTQGSEASMPPFMGRIKAKQNEFIKFLNTNVIDLLRETYDFIAPDATFVLEEPKIMAIDYYIKQVVDLINTEMLTPAQGAEYLKKIGIIDEDILNYDVNADEKTEVEKNAKIQVDVEPAKTNPDGSPKKEPTETEKIITKKSNILAEAIKADVSFKTFKNRLKHKDSNMKTDGWVEINTTNIGGKVIRLIKSEKIVMLFDGLEIVETYMLENIKMDTIQQAYNDYKDKLKKLQDEYEHGDTAEDIVIEEMGTAINVELGKTLDNLIKSLTKNTVKKEGFTEKFLTVDILDKINSFFIIFNKNTKKILDRTMDKLGLVVVGDDIDNVTTTSNVKDIIKSKNSIIKKSLQAQMIKTKNDIIADIKSQIIKGITAGRSAKDIKKDIEESHDYKNGVTNKISTLLRSEARNATTLLKFHKWLESGYTEYVWLSKFKDNPKFRQSHRDKNQKVYSIKEALESSPTDWDAIPGRANNCKCTSIPYS